MDPWVEKQERREMKKNKRLADRITYISDAQYGIPTSCPCGGEIKEETSPIPKFRNDFDTLPGSRYFTCKMYKDDGLHFRQPWVFGVQEEIQTLKMKVNDMAEEIAKLKALIGGPHP